MPSSEDIIINPYIVPLLPEGNFVEEQKAVNAQANQRIDTVEDTLNKRIENLQYEIS